MVSLLTIGLSYGLYKGILDNYLAEVVKMGEFDRDLLEFFRELPRFLLVFIIALLCSLPAEKIFKLASIIMIIGILLLASVPATKILVIASIFIYSTGEHIQLGMKNTLCLDYAKQGHGGEALGI